MKYEIRSFGGDASPKMREESRTIVGYALLFNSPSQIMRDWLSDTKFEERISPSALSPELLAKCDVRALMEHNRERLLARSNKGVGSLSLSIDEKGLRYEFEAPNTPDGDTAVELVRRGDIAGSSFAFRAKEEDIDKEWDKERKLWVHTINRFSDIRDVTLTADPAYLETSVEARSLVPPKEAIREEQLADYRKRIERL